MNSYTGSIYRDSNFFTYMYCRPAKDGFLGECHRPYNLEENLIIEFTDEEFKKLNLIKEFKTIFEGNEDKKIGKVDLQKFLSEMSVCLKPYFGHVMKCNSILEFKTKLAELIESETNEVYLNFLRVGLMEPLEENYTQQKTKILKEIANNSKVAEQVSEKLKDEIQESLQTKLQIVSKLSAWLG